MGGVLSPYSQLGDLLLAAEQDATGTAVRLPYHPDFWAEHAMREIYSAFGDVIEVQPGSLLKFGSNFDLGTGWETVQSQGGDEVYATANTITTISSSSASDTSVLAIEGHTIDGDGNFTFVTQTKALNGQNKVLLDTPLARCSRLYNNDGVLFVGNIYVYEDDTLTAGVPDTADKIHTVALVAEQQSQKCSTTVSNNQYWIITQGWASVNKRQSATVDFHLQVRQKGGVFRTRADVSLSNASGSHDISFHPYMIVPQNSDIRVRAQSSTASTSVSANLNGFLATIKVDN